MMIPLVLGWRASTSTYFKDSSGLKRLLIRGECTPAEGRSTCTVVLAVTRSWQPLGDAMWEVKGRAETLIWGHNAAWAREGVTLARATRR